LAVWFSQAEKSNSMAGLRSDAAEIMLVASHHVPSHNDGRELPENGLRLVIGRMTDWATDAVFIFFKRQETHG